MTRARARAPPTASAARCAVGWWSESRTVNGPYVSRRLPPSPGPPAPVTFFPAPWVVLDRCAGLSVSAWLPPPVVHDPGGVATGTGRWLVIADRGTARDPRGL